MMKVGPMPGLANTVEQRRVWPFKSSFSAKFKGPVTRAAKLGILNGKRKRGRQSLSAVRAERMSALTVCPVDCVCIVFLLLSRSTSGCCSGSWALLDWASEADQEQNLDEKAALLIEMSKPDARVEKNKFERRQELVSVGFWKMLSRHRIIK